MGKHLQQAILHKAIEAPLFTKEVLVKVPLSVFENNDIYKELSTIIKRHYQTNKDKLTEHIFLTLAEEKLDRLKKGPQEQQDYFNAINELYEVRQHDDGSLIDEKIEGYIKKHMRMEVLKKAAMNLEDEKAMEEVDKAWKDIMLLDISGKQKEIINVIDDSEHKRRLLSTLQQSVISTGFTAIDDICGGGLAKGELGMVVAISGSGKSMTLINLATNYTRQGQNVLFIALEELENRMILKFEQAMLKQTKSSILQGSTLNETHYKKMQDFYKNHRENFGNLFFARYSPQTVTPAKIEQLIADVMVREGLQVDVVIIDYPELLRNPRATGNEADDGGKLFEEMRRIGQDYNVIMWTASQMNRTAYSALIKTSENMEGAHRKKNSAELILAVNQSPEEFDAGFIRMYADKIRNPPEGQFNRMQGFKVIGSTMTIRDYKDNERDEHEAILSELDNGSEMGFKSKKRDKKPNTPAPDYAGEINAHIQRTTGGGS